MNLLIIIHLKHKITENPSFRQENSKNIPIFALSKKTPRSGARVAEEARLESVYTPKGYRGFESPSLRFLNN